MIIYGLTSNNTGAQGRTEINVNVICVNGSTKCNPGGQWVDAVVKNSFFFYIAVP